MSAQAQFSFWLLQWPPKPSPVSGLIFAPVYFPHTCRFFPKCYGYMSLLCLSILVTLAFHLQSLCLLPIFYTWLATPLLSSLSVSLSFPLCFSLSLSLPLLLSFPLFMSLSLSLCPYVSVSHTHTHTHTSPHHCPDALSQICLAFPLPLFCIQTSRLISPVTLEKQTQTDSYFLRLNHLLLFDAPTGSLTFLYRIFMSLYCDCTFKLASPRTRAMCFHLDFPNL